jgi:toxin ParE1/3/4
MARVIRAPAAKQDILDVIKYTKDRWGAAQAREYAALIEDALIAIASDPERGKSRADLRPGMFAFHISQRGRSARHILFYRVNAKGTVEIVRFLHDAMDFDRQLR